MTIKLRESWGSCRKRLRVAIVAAITSATALVVLASAPGWWSERDVLTVGAPNDYGMLNQGQLKQLATQAAAEMDEKLPGGAGVEISSLIAAWRQPPLIGTIRNDYAPVVHGQLKTVAKLFYDRLISESYTGGPLVPGKIYPWTPTRLDDANFSIANIGQAKRIFSFDLSAYTLSLTDPTADGDHDGLTNLDEAFRNTNPEEGDTDGDGISDRSEIIFGLNPLIFDPLSIPGLRLLLTADSGLDLDENGLISTWHDRSVNAHAARAPAEHTRPTQSADPLTGAFVIRLDGNDSFELPNVMDGARAGEIFIVARLENFDNQYNGLCQFGTANGVAYSEDEGDLLWEDFGTSEGGPFPGPGSARLTRTHIYNTSITETGVSTVRFNGAELLTRMVSEVVFNDAPLIGNDFFNEHFKGDIAAVIVFDRVLTDSERSVVYNFLALRSGMIPPDNKVPVDGLRLWLRADAGVPLSGSVATWLDQSGNGNNAVRAEPNKQPVVVGDGINGMPSVRFDRTQNQSLDLGNIMEGAGQGEVFMVARLQDFDSPYNAPCQFGTGWGTSYSKDNEESSGVGTIWDDFGTSDEVGIDGPGSDVLLSSHIYNSSISGAERLLRFNGQVFRRGLPDDNPVVEFTDQPIIGANSISEYFHGDIAEVIVYGRQLTEVERVSVYKYLINKYSLSAFSVPEATTLAAYPVSSSSVDLSWTVAGSQHVVSTLERRTGEADYAVIATLSDLSSYTDINVSPDIDYTYRIKLSSYAGDSAYSAPVAITLASGIDAPTSAGLRLWLRSTQGVIQNGSGGLRWPDQSGVGNDGISATTGQGIFMVGNAIAGLPICRFVGGDEYFQLQNIMQAAEGGEIIAVMKVADKSAGEYPDNNNEPWNFDRPTGYHKPTADDDTYFFYNGFGLDGSEDMPGFPVEIVENYHIFDTSSGLGEWVERFNGIIHRQATDHAVRFGVNPVIGFGFVGDFAEILIYDHVLSGEDRDAINRYLTLKYELNPLALEKPQLGGYAVGPSKTDLMWSIAGRDSQHLVSTLERKSGSGEYAPIATLSDEYTYTDTGLSAGTSYTYRIKVSSYVEVSSYSEPINVVTGSGPDLPVEGLRLWLRATTQLAGPLVVWEDQSGAGNDAVQFDPSHQPVVVAEQFGDLPVVHFAQDGQNELYLPDLMAGASAGEIFIVLRKGNMDAAGLWTFGAVGSRYPSEEGGIGDDFASTEWLNAGEVLEDLTEFNLYNVGGDNSVWFQNLNGETHFRREANTVVFRENPILGNGQGSHFDGDIVEVLIYDHVLSDVERNLVNHYLTQRYPLGWDVNDFTAPQAPTGLTADDIATSSFTLSWTDAVDDFAVKDYLIYLNGDLINETIYSTFEVTGLTELVEYSFTVRARDFTGKISPESLALLVVPETAWPWVSNADGDADGDGVPNKKDARPDDPLVGQLSITITAPVNGATLP